MEDGLAGRRFSHRAKKNKLMISLSQKRKSFMYECKIKKNERAMIP